MEDASATKTIIISRQVVNVNNVELLLPIVWIVHMMECKLIAINVYKDIMCLITLVLHVMLRV